MILFFLILKCNCMKKISFLFLFFLVIGCSDDISLDKSNVLEQSTTTRSSGDKQYDLLGYGYDVSGEYYTSRSAKGQVIDIKAFQKDHPDRIDYNISSSNYGRLTLGTTAEDYTSNLSLNAEIGLKIPVFGGSLNANFDGSNHYSAKYSIAEYSLFIRRKQLFLTAAANLLSQYVTSKFKDDLNNQTPEYIIKNYGTHVLTDVVLGSRLTIMYRSAVSSTKKAETVKAGCSFNIMKIFNINVGGNYDQTLLQDNAEQEFTYRSEGGDPSKYLVGSLNLETQNLSLIDISAWQNSCTTDNMTLIDVEPGSALPLYELIADINKKNLLKSEIEKYLKEKAYKNVGEPIPLYRYTFDRTVDDNGGISYGNIEIPYSPTVDYYYTTDYSEYGKGKDGYIYDKILCNVYPVNSHPAEAIPLYEYQFNFYTGPRNNMYKYTKVKSFYTTNWDIYKQGTETMKYRRIACYVFPNTSFKDLIPLYSYESPTYLTQKQSTNPYVRPSSREKRNERSMTREIISTRDRKYGYNFLVDLSETPIVESTSRRGEVTKYPVNTTIWCYVLPVKPPM